MQVSKNVLLKLIQLKTKLTPMVDIYMECLLREVSLARKKLGESGNEFFQMFGETSPNKLLLLPKSLYNNLLE